MSNVGRPRVLAVTTDGFAIRQLRLEMPLCNLKRQGLIEDYFITDPHLQGLPDDYRFDVIWLQRVGSLQLLEALENLVGYSYVFDLDDFLLGKPTYTGVRWEEQRERREGIEAALRNCEVFTCTSQRLVKMLEANLGVSLSQKAMICPNGFEFYGAMRKPLKPAGLVWTSSDFPALIRSREPVISAICKFSKKYNLPIYGFGYFPSLITASLPNYVSLGGVPFFHHKALLASFPPLMGLAPLETMADQADLDFINSKSDLKIVEFGGFGHPSVYSDALPYTDTDLRCGVVTPNDESSWFEAMEIIYREKWRELDREQAGVVEARNMDRIAGKCWYGAIRKIQRASLLKGSDIKDRLRMSMEKRGAGRTMIEPIVPKRQIVDRNSYDNAYQFWKEYKKGHTARREALEKIDAAYSLPLFFALYPLYKIIKPLRKLVRFLKENIV